MSRLLWGLARRRGLHSTTRKVAMARSHKVDIGGLLAGGRQLMLVDDEVPIEAFEGIAFPRPARVHWSCGTSTGCCHQWAASKRGRRGRVRLVLGATSNARSCVDVDERFDPRTGRDDDPFGESNVLTGSRLDVADLGAASWCSSELPMGLRCSEMQRAMRHLRSKPERERCSCENGDTVANLKWKTPRSKTRSRRAANWKLNPVTTVECPQCHQPKRPHFACETAVRTTAVRSSRSRTNTPVTITRKLSGMSLPA